MKHFQLLFLLILISITLQAAHQKEITINAQNQTLESVLDEISRQTEINFSYSSSSIDVSQLVSINVQNQPMEDVLQQLLGDKYEYKIKRKHIILKKSKVKKGITLPPVEQIITTHKEEYNYITNQVYVKKICYSDSGTVLGDCPIITNEQKNEVMKKQLAILMLTIATTANAQTQDSTLTTKEQLSKAGKEFTNFVVEAANSTVQAVKIAADEIGKQTAAIKVSNTNNSTTSTNDNPAVEITADDSADEDADEQPVIVAENAQASDSESIQDALKVVPEPTQTEAKTKNVNQEKSIAATDSVHPFLFTLFYPFSFPELHPEKNTYNVSLNLLWGYNGGVKGAELGWIANVNRYEMSGFQGAGVVNASFGSVTGVQLAGVVNFAAKDTTAVQISGVVNSAQSARFQAAGVANANYGNGDVQMSGIVNFSAKGNSAVQLGGVVNVANTADVQIAGITNAALQSDVQVSGVANASGGRNVTQISGIANVTDTSSFQLGLVNIARKAGTQIGLVNVCDTAGGIMLGLVNVARKGALRQFEVSSSLSSMNVAYRMGARKFYTFLEVGYGYENKAWMYGLGLGSQIDFPKKYGMNIEALFQNVSVDVFRSESFNGLSQVRVVGYKQLAKHFTVFAGPAMYIYNSKLSGSNPVDFKAPYTIYSHTGNSYSTAMWLGLSAGIRF